MANYRHAAHGEWCSLRHGRFSRSVVAIDAGETLWMYRLNEVNEECLRRAKEQGHDSPGADQDTICISPGYQLINDA